MCGVADLISYSNGKKRRLLIVSYSLSGGGAERFTSNLIKGLNSSDFEIYLCILRDEITYELPAHVHLTVLHKYKPWHLPMACLKLRKLVQRVKPHTILSTIAYT